MPSRKRAIQAADGDGGDAGSALLHRIRNTWQFANLCQWIFMFGKAAKIDDSIDVDDIEAECLKPNSTLLSDLALAILKLVSSHRGLTHDIFDDQTRKQYLANAPHDNPFGDDENPHKFADFDVFTKIKVLQQLTQWTMIHPERIRDKVEEQKDTEQASWRIEPYGWDREDRTYFVLDDNRVYRLTEPPVVSARPKPKKGKSWRGGRRSSKRQRTLPSTGDPAADVEAEQDGELEPVDDGLGGKTWECIAVTLQEVRDFLESLGKTRDDNEKILRRQLETHLVPILEKQEESEKRKQVQRERELLNLAKMANAKRSSRIAGKIERQKQEEHEKEEELQRRENEAAKRREEQKLLKLEKERDFRLFSRQRRLQEREARRLQHEEELAQLSEDSRAASSTGRVSERRLQAEIERNRQALRDLEEEEEDWVFDCVCGLYGQVDDGAHSVACEKCSVWQHSKCLGVSEEDADRPEFHFVCGHCKAPPRSTIKLKLNPTGSSAAHHRQADNHPLLPSTKTSASSDEASALPTEQGQLAAQAPLPESSPLHSVPLVAQNISPMSTLSSSITCAAREPTYQPVHQSPILQNENAGTSRVTESQQGQQPLTEAAFRGKSPSSKDDGTDDSTTKMTGPALAAVSPVTNAGANFDSTRNGTFVDPSPDSPQATFNVQRAPSFTKALLPGPNVPYPTNAAHDTNGSALKAEASSTPAERSSIAATSPSPHEQAPVAQVGTSSPVRDDSLRK